MCIATREIMDCMFEAYLEASLEPDDIPQTTEPVWILGKNTMLFEVRYKFIYEVRYYWQI